MLNVEEIAKITNGKTMKELREEYEELLPIVTKFNEDGFDFSDHKNIRDERFKMFSRLMDIAGIFDFQTVIVKKQSISKMRSIVNKHKKAIIKIKGGKCEICKFDFSDILIIHHIIPLSEEGTNDFDNLSVLCPNCHAIVHKAISRSEMSKKNETLSNILIWVDDYYTVNQCNRFMEIAVQKRFNLKRKLK